MDKTATQQAELIELETKFDEVSEWLLTNNLLHPEWNNKTKIFNELDEQITNLIHQSNGKSKQHS